MERKYTDFFADNCFFLKKTLNTSEICIAIIQKAYNFNIKVFDKCYN